MRSAGLILHLRGLRRNSPLRFAGVARDILASGDSKYWRQLSPAPRRGLHENRKPISTRVARAVRRLRPPVRPRRISSAFDRTMTQRARSRASPLADPASTRRRMACEESNLSGGLSSSAAPTQPARSRWGAFGSVAFTVIWAASVMSNVGTAMFDTASGWLITSLDANPMTVSLVQVAVSFPLFLFTLPAGALADVIDSRRLLIAVELAILAVSVIFAGLVSLDLATPALLLATTFLLGVGGAL